MRTTISMANAQLRERAFPCATFAVLVPAIIDTNIDTDVCVTCQLLLRVAYSDGRVTPSSGDRCACLKTSTGRPVSAASLPKTPVPRDLLNLPPS